MADYFETPGLEETVSFSAGIEPVTLGSFVTEEMRDVPAYRPEREWKLEGALSMRDC
jgi:hypothetical protein